MNVAQSAGVGTVMDVSENFELTGPARALQLLHAEDEPNDALLCQLQLERAGLAIAADVVTSRDGFIEALRTKSYDIVLTDYKLPAGRVWKCCASCAMMAATFPAFWSPARSARRSPPNALSSALVITCSKTARRACRLPSTAPWRNGASAKSARKPSAAVTGWPPLSSLRSTPLSARGRWLHRQLESGRGTNVRLYSR